MAVFIFASVHGAYADDTASCISAAKRANVRCWDRCSGDREAVEDCTANCDADYEQRRQGCTGASSSATQKTRPKLSGAKGSGESGCYFGECPDDLDKKIETSTDPADDDIEDNPQPKHSKRRPTTPATPATTQTGIPMTSVCQTPAFWCVMNQVGPVWSSCWCASVYGPINGVTVPQH